MNAGTGTASEAVEASLSRIAARDHRVRAWVDLDEDGARSRADELDRSGEGSSDGPLRGVPVGIKAIIDVAGVPIERGCTAYEGRVPDADAAVVARLREAGAVVLGTTVTTEVALFHPGPTRNPHDPTRTPGGSSSGSAAAVADGHVPVTLGTQTAGSIVRPASFCGVYGHKPTVHVVPTDGALVVSPTLDTIGGFARDVALLRALHGVLSGGAVPAPRQLERPRVGVLRGPDWDAIDADCRGLLDAAFDALSDHAEIEEVVGPDGFDGLVEAQETVMRAEAARHLDTLRSEHADDLSDQLLAYLDTAADHEPRYDAALEHAGRLRAPVDDLLAGYDAVVTPSVVGEAPVGDATGDPLLCRVWTLLGTPAVAVPGLAGPAGMPLGVQVVAARGQDAAALDAAAWLGEVWS